MLSKEIIHIVDDDEAIRKSLSLLMKSVGLTYDTYASAQEFLNKYDPSSGSGCLVLDIRMPGISGLELQEMLPEKRIHIPVIIMTGHGDVPMAVRALKAGAWDFIEKPFKNQVLLDRIYEALTKAEKDRKTHDKQIEAQSRLTLLTPRERETLALLVEGKLNKQVAAELSISVRTVEAHRAKIMEKLQARSLSDLVRLSLVENQNSIPN